MQYVFNKNVLNYETGTAAVAQLVRALALQAEGWLFESQPRQTQVVKTDDSSTAKRSAKGGSATGSRR